MQPEPLRPELSAVEAALASLAPRSSGLDRDRLMYLAGQAAGLKTARRRPAAWLWPCATAASLLLAAVLGLRGPRPGEQVASRPVEVTPPAPAIEKPRQSDPNEYFRLRELVLRHGVEALPDARPENLPGRGRRPARAWDRPGVEIEG